MECILLAGGMGTRLKKQVPLLPKPLAPIQGVPFLQFLLNQLANSKIISKVIFAIGYKSDLIVEFIESRKWPFETFFSIEKTPLGTGGSLSRASQLVQEDNCFVMNADSFFNISFSRMLKQHYETKSNVTIAIRKQQDSSRYGQITIDKSTLQIQNFQEKVAKKESFINGGIYLFARSIFKYLPEKEVFSLEEEGFSALLNKQVYAFVSDALFIDIGVPDAYKKAQTLLKARTK